MLVTFFFPERSLALAQRLPRVALALHNARRSALLGNAFTVVGFGCTMLWRREVMPSFSPCWCIPTRAPACATLIGKARKHAVEALAVRLRGVICACARL